MKYLIVLILILSLFGCGGRLSNYDVGLGAGHTEYDNSEVSPSTTVSVRFNFHFDVGR